MSEHQPCWKCGRSCGGKGCVWADKLEPVPGWKAIECKDGEYTIVWCPLFINSEEVSIE